MATPRIKERPHQNPAPPKDEPVILILSGVKGDTRRYRTFHPYEQLRLAGVDSELSHITDPELPDRISRAALTIFHRTTYDPHVERLLQGIRRRGGLAILDVDDLVFDPAAFQWIDSPDFQDPVRAALYREDMRRHRATLEACQAVTASTEYLAGLVRAQEKPTWVHRNAFSLEMLALSERAYQNREPHEDQVIIGYASGTPTHDRDFAVVRPALQAAMLRHPQAELWLVGSVDPGGDWGPLADRVKRHKLVPWRELPRWLAQFDINLAPLVTDNPFARSKSEIKYVEAGLVRTPTIASPTEAFRHAIRPGENGFLAANEGEWGEALSLLIGAAQTRRRVAESAYAHILAHYHPAVRAAELVRTLDQVHRELAGRPLWETPAPKPAELQPDISAAGPGGPWIDPAEELSPSLARMGIYTLRHRGLRTLLMQIWIYLRRWLAPLIPYRKA